MEPAISQFLREYVFRNVINPFPPRQNGTILADSNFKCIFSNENYRIPIRISLKFISRSPIDNKAALV